jgi:minor extracellular serine protease Vpr
MRSSRIAWLVLACSTCAAAAGASPEKLDPRARVALARIRGGERVEQMLERRAAVDPRGDLDVFVEGSVTREELKDAGTVVRTALPGVFTAFVPERSIDRVIALPGVTAVRGAAPVEVELDASVPAMGVTALRGVGPDFPGVNGAGVLIGAVDSGVDFTHGDFKNAAGLTRFVRIWDQTGVGVPPVGYLYGAEWSSAQIDVGVCLETDLVGHGTHVLGIAGGDGSQTAGSVPAYTYAGVAPKADLVMVKSSFTNSGILDGVKYVFDLATARGQKAVVNLSIGSQFGPHDGTDAFESGLNALTGPGRIIVKSAGNDRGVARHAEALAAGSGTNVTLAVAGSAVGKSVQIDGYYESTENVSVKITTPNGTVIGPVTRGSIGAAYPGASTTSGNVYLENGFSRTPGGDYEVYLEINTAANQNANGTWTIAFIPVALGAARGEVDLWRFFSSSGVTADFVLGNQQEELITEPGNARDMVTVAGYVTKRNWTNCNSESMSYPQSGAVGTIAWFSSPGPTRDSRWKPDIAAPGAAIASATSFDFTQACASGSSLMNDGMNHVIMSGTSMSAPHVTGIAALVLQVRGALTPQELKDYLYANSIHDANTGSGWNKDWGQGKVHLPLNVAPVEREPAIDAAAIVSIVPNPTIVGPTIVYVLPRSAAVRLGIVDVQGRSVATLAQGVRSAGRHEARWDLERAGRRPPAGLYFVVLESGKTRTLRRVVLTR